MLIKTDPDIIAGYLQDASGFTQGRAERLVIPANPAEVAEYLAAASARREPVTVAGGRTGVAAGCIPTGGTLLSLEALNGLEPISCHGGEAAVATGPAVRLGELKKEAGRAGLMYGPDPTEKTGSLGGNAATNASGGQCFKYGPTRNHVLALTAVLATGEVVSLARGQCRAQGDHLAIPLASGRTLDVQRPLLPALKISKNAAGYYSEPGMDALDLFIGMDGTLAVITALKLRLLPAPAGSFALAVFFFAAAGCSRGCGRHPPFRAGHRSATGHCARVFGIHG